MTTVKPEPKSIAERRIKTCSVNHLIFNGCIRSKGKKPSAASLGFTGGLLPLSSPAQDANKMSVSGYDLPDIDNAPSSSFALATRPPMNRSISRVRTSGHQGRNPSVLAQHRSRSAPTGCADIHPQVVSPGGDPITYNWITESDIRTNVTKEAAGRFYKHTYGTGSCHSIQVNFPAAGRFVDNHRLNSKQRGFVKWADTR